MSSSLSNLLAVPAEWKKQSIIQLTWPDKSTDWEPYINEIQATMLTIATEILKHEDLLIVAKDIEEVRAYIHNNITDKTLIDKITFHQCPTNDTWARDHGAITLAPKEENSPIPQTLLDFCFNGWGKKFASHHDNAITRSIIKNGVFPNHRHANHLDFVLEGGAIESDGKGTIFTTSQCLLAPNRNQPLNKTEIEEQLKERLCAKRIIWIDYGTLIGDDTDGHIDTIVRLAPNDTILYVDCQDKGDEQYTDFLNLKKQLQMLKTLDNKPYNLLPLPMPDAIYYNDERLPATYANFLIINDAVLVPIYRQTMKDQEAMSIIQKAFPDREIVGIDCNIVIRQHGSLHCLTMQYY